MKSKPVTWSWIQLEMWFIFQWFISFVLQCICVVSIRCVSFALIGTGYSLFQATLVNVKYFWNKSENHSVVPALQNLLVSFSLLFWFYILQIHCFASVCKLSSMLFFIFLFYCTLPSQHLQHMKLTDMHPLLQITQIRAPPSCAGHVIWIKTLRCNARGVESWHWFLTFHLLLIAKN